MVSGSDEIEIPFFVNEDKGEQYRLSITTFRDKYYLSIRKWFLGFEEEWVPTKEGVSIPYNLDTVSCLFSALCSLMAEAEVLEDIGKHLIDKGKAE